MAMVLVGKVEMLVRELAMPMHVAVRIPGRIRRTVLVSVVLVVLVEVLVLERLVSMPMGVALAQQQHDARGHREHGQHPGPTEVLIVQEQ